MERHKSTSADCQQLIHIEVHWDTKNQNSIYHIFFYGNIKQLNEIRISKGWVVNPPRNYKIRVDAQHNKNPEHIHIIYKRSGKDFFSIDKNGRRHHHRGEEIEIP